MIDKRVESLEEAVAGIDDHKGLKAARPRRHLAKMPRALRTCWPMPAARAGASSPPSSPPPAQEDADQLRPKVPKLAVLMDEAEHDVLVALDNGKRRTNVVGIFPNEAAIGSSAP